MVVYNNKSRKDAQWAKVTSLFSSSCSMWGAAQRYFRAGLAKVSTHILDVRTAAMREMIHNYEQAIQ